MPNDGFDKNAIIFGADISSSANVDSKIIYISYSEKKDLTQGLDDTTLTLYYKVTHAAEYSIKFTEAGMKLFKSDPIVRWYYIDCRSWKFF